MPKRPVQSPIPGVAILLSCACLAACPIPARASADGNPVAWTVERLLDWNLPREAAREFSILPGAGQGRDPALPRLLRALADAGEEDRALALFESLLPHLVEPVRSGALLEAGKIRWRRKQPEAALSLFAGILPASAEGREAASYIVRGLAAKGDFDGAARVIAEAPQDTVRQLLAGEIEKSRGSVPAALAIWNAVPAGTPSGDAARLRLYLSTGDRGGAARTLRAMADNAADSFPVHVEALQALTRVLLLAGDRTAALAAAREGIAVSGRWKSALAGIPPWDGTAPGAKRSLESAPALFPLDEDAGGFRSAERRFLSLASLRDTLAESEERALAMSMETRRTGEAAAVLRERLAVALSRAGVIRSRFLDDARRAREIPARLSQAAYDLSLPDWGERVDPRNAALLGEVKERLEDLSRKIARLKSLTPAAADRQDPKSPSTRAQQMVTYAQERVARAEQSIEFMKGKGEILRAKVWNRWKESSLREMSRIVEDAERAALRADAGTGHAEKAQASLRTGIANLAEWETSLAWMSDAFDRDAVALHARWEETGRIASEAFTRARREILQGVDRRERALHRLAGRAAAEGYLEGKEASPDNAVAASPALAREAIRHLEASLPPPGEREPFTDESLFILAALRFDEAERRSYSGKEVGNRGAPDLSATVSTFRKLLADHPGSPYADSSLYGIALCHQETGASDNAAEILEALLTRYPSTRYADEANLRLGEHRFDQYDFPRAESAYRKVRAAAELRAIARFKLGWALFLQNRPGEAAESFLEAALPSPSAAGTGALREEARRMTARSLVEAGGDRRAESFLAQRGGDSEGPAVLLWIQQFLDAQNRYEEAAEVASRLGAAYPLAAERVDGEEAAVAALRKGKREVEAMARRGAYYRVFGTGTEWQGAPGRTVEEISRANSLAMEGLAAAGFYFHAATRERPPGDRGRVYSLYDAFLARFPSSPKAEEVGYQRGWLLFEDGRKAAAMTAFEDVARRPSGTRGEPARYMALQCAKDVAAPDNAYSQGELIRLAREYERAFPKGERRQSVLADRARAHLNRKEWDDAADAALESGRTAADPADRGTAFRIAGEARFEAGRTVEAEKLFRSVLALSLPPAERSEVEKWAGFSMFRTAERLPPGRESDAGALFLRIAGEFPALEIVPQARFRAGAAFEEGKMDGKAIDAYLSVERMPPGSPLAVEATRRLAVLYERGGKPLPAADRLAGLSPLERADEGKAAYLFRAAELYQQGKEEEKARRAWRDAASISGAPATVRVLSLFRAGESARAQGMEAEAEMFYHDAVKLHRESGGAAPEIAGRALFQRAEARFRAYLSIRIVPPLKKTFAEKQNALEGCAALYAEAVRVGDIETVAASFHRLGESFEDFRSAILGSPPPRALSAAEKEEYVFLLEERAAPIEERAVESYRSSLRQAVAADHFSAWVAKSRERLRALRPALFARKVSFATSVAYVPDFLPNSNRPTVRKSASEISPALSDIRPVEASRVAWDRDASGIPPPDGSAESRLRAMSRNRAAFRELRKGDAAAARGMPEDPGGGDSHAAEHQTDMGIALAELGRWKDAKEVLERAVLSDPSLPEGWLNLGLYREVYLGDGPGALSCYERYIALNSPRKDEVVQWSEWLRKPLSSR
jgi:tetratricopeptide (TPR) repeat protein